MFKGDVMRNGGVDQWVQVSCQRGTCHHRYIADRGASFGNLLSADGYWPMVRTESEQNTWKSASNEHLGEIESMNVFANLC